MKDIPEAVTSVDDLATVLAPVSVETFAKDHAFRAPLVVSGHPNKFAGLFSWTSLARLLTYSRHDPMRVHLNRVGATDDQLTFTRVVTNVRNEPIERIDADLLLRRLQEGATLVVDSVNEIDPQVSALTERVALLFASPRTTAVLFASFGHVPGFLPHWDNRDVLALQVEGEKRWTVYEPSVPSPLERGDAGIGGSGEPGALVWDGVLKAGDLIYVPRGWWHTVTSTDQPSAHLNVGVGSVTPLDFLRWLADCLGSDDAMRADIPRFAGPEELAAYERQLKQTLVEQLDGTSLEAFLTSLRAEARVLPDIRFPLADA